MGGVDGSADWTMRVTSPCALTLCHSVDAGVSFNSTSTDNRWLKAMPKDAIRRGLRSQLEAVTAKYSYDSITVPSKATQSCTFRTVKRKGWTTIPFEVLLEVMEFALDNTVIRDFDGCLRKQMHGIPMGDPHSLRILLG